MVGTSSVYYELACCLCSFGRWKDAMAEVSFFVCETWVYIVLDVIFQVWNEELCVVSVDVTHLITTAKSLESSHLV